MNARQWLIKNRKQISEEARGLGKSFAWILVFYLGGLIALNLLSTSWGSRFAFLYPHIAPASSLAENSIDQTWGILQGEYLLRGIPGNSGTQAAEQAFVDLLHEKYGDRFSALLSPSEFASFSQSLDSQRRGSIGVAVEARCNNGAICPSGQTPSLIVFEDVLINQPADKAGLRNGDVLLAVNGRPINSFGSDVQKALGSLADVIRGSAGSSVRLTVKRSNQTLTFSVVRENLNVPSVYSQLLGTNLYIQITGMDSDTPELLRQQLQTGESHGATGVILDLRDNGGGLTSTAQAVVSQFVAPGAGRQDVYVARGRLDSSEKPETAQTEEHVPLQSGGMATHLPIAVLVNGDTASAAEITTAALHDYHRAVVIGTKTFGKGSVVRDYPLPDGEVLHLVTERWYGPDGENIDVQGITPDKSVQLPNPDSQFGLSTRSAPAAGDAQLQAALAALVAR